jgi:hypothetical protein
VIAGITADSGAGALLACSTFALVVVAGTVIVDGWRRRRAQRRHPLTALGRVCTGDRR